MNLLNTRPHLLNVPLVLIRGNDSHLRDKALTHYRSRIGRRLDATQTPPADIVTAILTPSLTGDTTLVQGAEAIGKSDEFDAWLHIKERDHLAILLVTQQAKMDPHYVRVISHRGIILDCDTPLPNDRHLKTHIARLCARNGVVLNPHLKQWLARNCHDITTIEHILVMLSCGYRGHRITEATLEAFHIERRSGPERIIEHIANAKPREAILTLARSIRLGAQPESLAKGMTRGLLRRIRLLEAMSGRIGQAAQRAGVDQRRAPLLLQQARQLGRPRMLQLTTELTLLTARPSITTPAKLLQWTNHSAIRTKLSDRPLTNTLLSKNTR